MDLELIVPIDPGCDETFNFMEGITFWCSRHNTIPRFVTKKPEKIDLIFLPGGDDIPPHYNKGISTVKERECPNSYIDLCLELLDYAFIKNIPVLGTCLGIHIINIWRGGTIIPDIPGHMNVWHRLLWRKTDMPMPRYVNSFHHEGIHKLGSGLIPYAWTKDGLIECVRLDKIIGVQWHPERMRYSEIMDWFLSGEVLQ